MEQLKQAKNLIEKSENILIAPNPELSGDNLGSALALFFTLRKLGKNVNTSIKEIPDRFRFLINNQGRSQSQDFVVSVKDPQKNISALRYEKTDQDLKIYLTLGQGELKINDLALTAPVPAVFDFSPGQKFDLLITIGVKSPEDLPDFFSQNNRLFYQVPILNIDNQLSNEGFGDINLLKTTSSLSEISMSLIEELDPTKMIFDQTIARSLLMGIVWAWQNFRHPRTRPQTFEASAFLMEKGANLQEIVHHLYKQRNLPQIKLLGKALEKLNFNQEKNLYLISLKESDFQECLASSQDLVGVLEELRLNFHCFPDLLLLWETHASPLLVKGFIYSPKIELTEKILENFEGVSKKEGVLFLVREKDLALAQEKILKII